MLRNKIKGMLIGGAVGDALGAPIETWPPEKTAEVHGGPITGYVAPIGHKWFTPETMPAGSTTDDTQLTVATMEGMILGNKRALEQASFDPYMDGIALAHVEAMAHCVGGWGKSTTEAIRRIANGVHWSQSGKTTENNRGTGNGVPMKCSGLAAWYLSKIGGEFLVDKGNEFAFNQRCVDFSAMTHWSQMSAYATIVHTTMLYYLLTTDPGNITEKYFYDTWAVVDEWAAKDNHGDHSYFDLTHLNPTDDDIRTRFQHIYALRETVPPEELTVERLRAEFGNGSCYLFDSLPFSYAMFLRGLTDHENDLQSILDTANAGGDSDTNAHFVGEMMGAYMGLDLFLQHKWSVDGLKTYDELIDLADRFCDTFGIK